MYNIYPCFFLKLKQIFCRWMGPMSVSMYAPGDDFKKTVDTILYYRYRVYSVQLHRISGFIAGYTVGQIPDIRGENGLQAMICST